MEADKQKLIDDLLKKRRSIASVTHPCSGVNPLTTVRFRDGDFVEVSAADAEELQCAQDASAVKVQDVLNALGD